MKHYLYVAAALALGALPFSGCEELEAQHTEEEHEVHHTIVVTSPVVKEVTATTPYVCQIHSCRHIDIRALEGGYLEDIPVKEGQTVKKGDLMFKILGTIYQATLQSEIAEAKIAQIELTNSQKLFKQNMVSDQDVALAEAKLAKAQAQVDQAQAEYNFTSVTAPFDGIIDRLHEQQGSLIDEGAILTTLSDNSTMWVYFNVPEALYLEYQTQLTQGEQDLDLDLVLANGATFNQEGKIAAIEADFNPETGNIAFRADFPNPNRLLRHGQTGVVLIHRKLKGAVVIPQRATYEILDKRFIFLVDDDGKVHQHEIKVLHEMDDIYVIGGDISGDDKIVLEGVRQVRDGEEVEYEYVEPSEVLSHLKFEAE
ncbi:Efflux pump periplasmic linker BepF [Posidoniimonas polymericola]|uniref:Efflux pump periplasmic linker BepF n=1 Tax=Posidoniimonas polymericola TaxID=2528002 RepID=A0A5C5YU05_9BACT|nr:efflux RND transporter periplasmic adaptor subunit [Posidoniimonas polymericola]TWT78236.1 Efflux pump periplasmic linker BepF [Posidoniimonas polymericola]